MWRSAFLVLKTSDFFEICGVSTRIREGAVRSFCGQEGRGQFSRFCADIFYGRPLNVITNDMRIILFIYAFNFTH